MSMKISMERTQKVKRICKTDLQVRTTELSLEWNIAHKFKIYTPSEGNENKNKGGVGK